ncbi:MAG: glycosyl transferase [Anaerolineae bacterium]|jgi:cellobiose phosphorylase|nr:glycosyl transferase [Anaerolineae bacterium]MDH7474075.1 glycosyl transferase [Anaerolineae bacterium]
MDYGYFDDEHREYVITNPKTPTKWINYIGTLAFGGFVDHTGGALICKEDPALNRITKYITQLPSAEFKGETLYLRFREGKGYKVFSPFFVPTLDSYDLYECHVGLGYTRIVSEFYGLRTEVTIFVPWGGSQEIRDIRITNISSRPLEIDAIPVVEYTHPDALKQLTNADWVPQTMQSKAHREEGGLLILTQYPFMFKDMRINYFTSNRPVSSFESDRRRFLGDNEYGTWANPLSLQQDELGNYEAQRGDNIAALLHHLGLIQPGETVQLITQLGQAASLAQAQVSIHRYRDPKQVTQALGELADFWDQYLSKFQVETPDPAVNSLLNIHNPRQCYITLNWSRYLSLYQLGYGARGIGFRDSSQDVMGVLAGAPTQAQGLIRQLLQVQKRDGSAMHQFNPLTMVANEGDSREVEDAPKYYSDDHLWIVLAVTAYLKETSDLAFLDEVLPYYEKDREGQPLASGTVLDHLRRAIEFTWQDVGAHGLPLLGFADWNDTVNLRRGAESLFTANLFGRALLEMIELSQHLGDAESAARYRQCYETMKQRVNEHAWDGEWYVRYFDADGTPLGSRHNTHGQIYTNGQSWPVISGFAPPDRARAALDAVYRRLNTSKGIKLSTPGYNGFDPAKGGITTYPPGAKENGGIFLHTNPWVIIAETMLGNGERAWEYYSQINPVAKNDQIDEYECEPYVFPQNILGDEHPQFGLARNSWLTGTASWAYQAATQYILGIRPAYDGLQIDPCIPRRWDGFKVTRTFRNALYQIEVRNPDRVCKGVRSIKVDGEDVQGNIMPVFCDGQIHRVEVVMG